MAPALRREYGLSLAQNRFGERVVLFAGLAGSGVALLAAGYAGSFVSLAVLIGVAGAAGASVQSASGRAVMHWFAPGQRGLALAIRQTAIPISGFLAPLALPLIGSARWGFGALGIASLAGAVVGGAVLREGPQPDPAPVTAPAPLRDGRLWRLSVGSSLVLAPQLCVVGFTVLLLHERRGLSASTAAAVLAVMQFLAIGGRIGAGRWSDVAGSRIVPLRHIALGAASLIAIAGLLLGAPLALLLPVLVAGGVLAMSWNSLSFAAAVEFAGHARSGIAIGFQQTLLNVPGAAYPPLFGALVAATSWRVGLLAAALFPLAGWFVLGGLRA